MSDEMDNKENAYKDLITTMNTIKSALQVIETEVIENVEKLKEKQIEEEALKHKELVNKMVMEQMPKTDKEIKAKLYEMLEYLIVEQLKKQPTKTKGKNTTEKIYCKANKCIKGEQSECPSKWNELVPCRNIVSKGKCYCSQHSKQAELSKWNIPRNGVGTETPYHFNAVLLGNEFQHKWVNFMWKKYPLMKPAVEE